MPPLTKPFCLGQPPPRIYMRSRTHQTMTVQLLDGLAGEDNVFEFDKAHRPVDLLAETHALEARGALEQASERLLQEVGRQGRRRDGRQVAHIERVDLPGSAQGNSPRDATGRTGGFWSAGFPGPRLLPVSLSRSLPPGGLLPKLTPTGGNMLPNPPGPIPPGPPPPLMTELIELRCWPG